MWSMQSLFGFAGSRGSTHPQYYFHPVRNYSSSAKFPRRQRSLMNAGSLCFKVTWHSAVSPPDKTQQTRVRPKPNESRESRCPVLMQRFSGPCWPVKAFTKQVLLSHTRSYTDGAAGTQEQFGVQSLAQGYFNMLTVGSGTELGSFWSSDLSHSRRTAAVFSLLSNPSLS